MRIYVPNCFMGCFHIMNLKSRLQRNFEIRDEKKKDQTELVSCFNSMILHMHALTCFKVLFIGGCFIL